MEPKSENECWPQKEFVNEIISPPLPLSPPLGLALAASFKPAKTSAGMTQTDRSRIRMSSNFWQTSGNGIHSLIQTDVAM